MWRKTATALEFAVDWFWLCVCGGGSQGIALGRIYPWETTKDASEVCQSALISLRRGQRGYGVPGRVSQFYRVSCFLSASKSTGCLRAAAVKYITKASSWETLSQSKQASAARCSKYEPVIWSLRFFSYQTTSFTFQGLWQSPIKEQKKKLHKTIVWVLDPDHDAFQICMKHKQMRKDVNGDGTVM